MTLLFGGGVILAVGKTKHPHSVKETCVLLAIGLVVIFT